LTPEEWASYPKVYFRRPRGQDGHVYNEGYGVEIAPSEDGDVLWVWDDSWAVTIQHADRHKLASVALARQPYGFTWGDVAALKGVGMTDLADRVAALLPPLEERTEP
jgi:hypothetical protein